MEVRTVTTADQALLAAVRETLSDADSALLCVAFVHARGLHLIERELRSVTGTARLVATTTFDQTNGAALALAAHFGAHVRTLNPGSGITYHPKVYLSRRGKNQVEAVVGSANLTGGLATNLEVGVLMRGTLKDRPLLELNQWAEAVWADQRCGELNTMPMAAEATADDELEPQLLDGISREVARDRVFLTLGRQPARNIVTEVTRAEVLVETERSIEQTGQAASIPAWMFNIAWDYLQTNGALTNRMLLGPLRVHRSSAVCAILARMPGVERVPGQVAVRLIR